MDWPVINISEPCYPELKLPLGVSVHKANIYKWTFKVTRRSPKWKNSLNQNRANDCNEGLLCAQELKQLSMGLSTQMASKHLGNMHFAFLFISVSWLVPAQTQYFSIRVWNILKSAYVRKVSPCPISYEKREPTTRLRMWKAFVALDYLRPVCANGVVRLESATRCNQLCINWKEVALL